MIEQKYINFNGLTKDLKLAEQASKDLSKAGVSIQNEDINQSNIPWRILQKQLTEHVRKYRSQQTDTSGIPDGLF